MPKTPSLPFEAPAANNASYESPDDGATQTPANTARERYAPNSPRLTGAGAAGDGGSGDGSGWHASANAERTEEWVELHKAPPPTWPNPIQLPSLAVTMPQQQPYPQPHHPHPQAHFQAHLQAHFPAHFQGNNNNAIAIANPALPLVADRMEEDHNNDDGGSTNSEEQRASAAQVMFSHYGGRFTPNAHVQGWGPTTTTPAPTFNNANSNASNVTVTAAATSLPGPNTHAPMQNNRNNSNNNPASGANVRPPRRPLRPLAPAPTLTGFEGRVQIDRGKAMLAQALADVRGIYPPGTTAPDNLAASSSTTSGTLPPPVPPRPTGKDASRGKVVKKDNWRP